MNHCRGAAGFTLLEILIALSILLTGVLSTVYLISRGIAVTNDTESVQQATALAQQRMEALRSGAFAALANEARAAVPGWVNFDRQVTVGATPVPPPATNAQIQQVVVTVFWPTTGGEQSVALTTYICNVVNN
jgi:prepilin-type N-terminal cleavage/methylation domain-containing protein